MKLESLKSEKFRKLENEEMNKINGGRTLLQDGGSTVTVTWTKASNKTDDCTSDVDE